MDNLPNDCKLYIAKFLGFRTLIKYISTCSSLYNLFIINQNCRRRLKDLQNQHIIVKIILKTMPLFSYQNFITIEREKVSETQRCRGGILRLTYDGEVHKELRFEYLKVEGNRKFATRKIKAVLKDEISKGNLDDLTLTVLKTTQISELITTYKMFKQFLPKSINMDSNIMKWLIGMTVDLNGKDLELTQFGGTVSTLCQRINDDIVITFKPLFDTKCTVVYGPNGKREVTIGRDN